MQLGICAFFAAAAWIDHVWPLMDRLAAKTAVSGSDVQLLELLALEVQTSYIRFQSNQIRCGCIQHVGCDCGVSVYCGR